MRSPKQLLLFAWLAAFVIAHPLCAQSWTQQTNSPAAQWWDIAASADGRKIAAVPFDGAIYISSDCGLTWAGATNAPDSGWTCIVSSADGIKLAAINTEGGPNNQDTVIYASTNSGAIWTLMPTPSPLLDCLASSADGSTLIAGDWNDFAGPSLIYTSHDSGMTWITNHAPSEYWTSVACSADGSKIVAGCVNPESTGTIFISSDGGTNWRPTNLPFTNWQAVASSADGSKLVAAVSGGSVYTSADSGQTWVPTSLPALAWISVASSADGARLVAVNEYGLINSLGAIYTSSDSGQTWLSNNVPNNVSWQSVVSSADGNSLAVATFENSIYTVHSVPHPQLSLQDSASSIALSWIIPAASFTLQQSDDLISWTNMDLNPTLNISDLKNQVILSRSNPARFYRLRAR